MTARPTVLRALSLGLAISLLAPALAACGRTERIRERASELRRTASRRNEPPRVPATRVATITLDDAHATEAFVGPRGGSLSLALAGGARASLAIPRGALLATTKVRLVPVSDAVGLPLGGGVLAAVQLEPEGLVLFRPATLTFESLPTTANGRPRGVAWRGRGVDVHHRPFRRAAGRTTFAVTHFSGYAFGGETEADARTESNRMRSGAEEEASDAISDTLQGVAGRQERDPDERPTDEEQRRIEEALRRWWERTVREWLISTETRDDLLETAITEYLSFWSSVTYVGLEERFAPEKREAEERIARGLANGIRRAYDRCMQHKTIEECATMVKWFGTAQMLGLEGRPGLTQAELRARMEDCLNLKIRLELRIQFGLMDESVRIWADLRIEEMELHMSRRLTEADAMLPPFEARGPLRYGRFEVRLDDEGCRPTNVGRTDGEAEVKVELDVNLRSEPPSARPPTGPDVVVPPGGSPASHPPAPPPVPYAVVSVTPTRAPMDRFTVSCEGLPSIPMAGPIAESALHGAAMARSRGDEAGASRGMISMELARRNEGPVLFTSHEIVRPTVEGETFEVDLRPEIVAGD